MSGNYFAVLGVPTLIGRPLTVDDDRTANGSPVTVISYAYWQRRFDGDPAVLGRTVTINRVPFTIVGVAPPGFYGEVVGGTTDLWMPLTMLPALARRDWLTAPGESWLLLLGRRAPNVTPGPGAGSVSDAGPARPGGVEPGRWHGGKHRDAAGARGLVPSACRPYGRSTPSR